MKKLKQFNLEDWLKDKSQRIVTRDGRNVIILDTGFEMGNGSTSILAKCIYNGKAAVYTYDANGKANNIGETENDLFFADIVEEELTKFEKSVSELIQKVTHNGNVLPDKDIKGYSSTLLDIVINELFGELGIEDKECFDYAKDWILDLNKANFHYQASMNDGMISEARLLTIKGLKKLNLAEIVLPEWESYVGNPNINRLNQSTVFYCLLDGYLYDLSSKERISMKDLIEKLPRK